MAKLLFWLLVALVAVFWFRSRARKRMPPPSSSKGSEVEDMVRCQVCSVNLPRSEAILSRGRFYCCPEHREQDRG